MRAPDWILIVAVLAVVGFVLARRGVFDGPVEAAPVTEESRAWVASVGVEDAAAGEAADRPVFVFWGGPWCGACVKLESSVLSKPEVRRALDEEYRFVKIDPAERDTPAGAHAYKTTRYVPELVIVTPGGELFRSLGPSDTGGPAEFARELRSIARQIAAAPPAARAPESASP